MASDPDAVVVLCELADTCVDRFAALALEGHHGAAVSLLTQIAALTPGDPQASIACQQCDQDHAPIVEFDPATAHHFYFCAEAGRVDVADTEIATLCLDPEWLVNWLQREIPIIPPARRRALVPGRVWQLGEAVIGGTALSVVFARGVSTQHELEELAEEVSHIPPETLGIVITTTTLMSELLLRFHRYFPLDLREIMRVDGNRLYLDRPRFASWIRGFLKGMHRPALDHAGRPSQKDLVLEIHREREERRCAQSAVTAEARGIQAELRSRHPDREPPAVKTIVRHLGMPLPKSRLPSGAISQNIHVLRRLIRSVRQGHLRWHSGEQPRGQTNMSAQETLPSASVEPIAVSPAEAARLVGIGRTTIYAAISSGELSSLKLGKRRLIVVAALRAWLQAHQVAP